MKFTANFSKPLNVSANLGGENKMPTGISGGVLINGKDGKDGKTGKQGPAGNIAGVVIEYNTPLYAVTSASQAPDKPNCIYDVQNNSLSVNSEG